MEQHGPLTKEQITQALMGLAAGETAAQPQAGTAARTAAGAAARRIPRKRRLRVWRPKRHFGVMQPPESKRERIAAGRAKLLKKAERSAMRSAAAKARNAVDAG